MDDSLQIKDGNSWKNDQDLLHYPGRSATMKFDSNIFARPVQPGMLRVIRPYEMWFDRGNDQM